MLPKRLYKPSEHSAQGPVLLLRRGVDDESREVGV